MRIPGRGACRHTIIQSLLTPTHCARVHGAHMACPYDAPRRRRRPAAPAAGRAIFSARHPGIPMNSYWVSVLILNLPDFSELAPPYMHHWYIRSLCTPTRDSHCGGPARVRVRACAAAHSSCRCLADICYLENLLIVPHSGSLSSHTHSTRLIIFSALAVLEYWPQSTCPAHRAPLGSASPCSARSQRHLAFQLLVATTLACRPTVPTRAHPPNTPPSAVPTPLNACKPLWQ